MTYIEALKFKESKVGRFGGRKGKKGSCNFNIISKSERNKILKEHSLDYFELKLLKIFLKRTLC